MNRNFRIFLFIGILALSGLACQTLTGGGSEGGGSENANILFEDDFSSNSNDWDVYSDDDGSTGFSNGQYKIVINIESFFYWANPRKSFTDVIVEVEATKVGGASDDNQFGIICRHTDVDNWYLLVIGSDGWASIRRRIDGADLEFLQQSDPGTAGINTGSSLNNLRAECVGNRLTLYVNGNKIVEAFDNSLTSGDVGLLAGTFDSTSVEVVFDNFVVKSP